MKHSRVGTDISSLLIVGASGVVGTSLVELLLERPVVHRLSRLVLLRRNSSNGYVIEREDGVDLSRSAGIGGWVSPDLAGLIYLARIRIDPNAAVRTARIVDVESFSHVLRQARVAAPNMRVVLASSTAAMAAPSPGSYGWQKRIAEQLIRTSGVRATAIRLPTVLPRSIDGRGASAFLNEALTCLFEGRAYAWPIEPDRLMRIMSARRAAESLVHALGLPMPCIPIDLPATVVSPRMLHDEGFARAGVELHCRKVVAVDKVMASRPTRVSEIRARALGFAPPETARQILLEAGDFLNRYVRI